MKKFLILFLTLGSLLTLTGCHDEPTRPPTLASDYIGTWKYTGLNGTVEKYLLITKTASENGYFIREFEIDDGWPNPQDKAAYRYNVSAVYQDETLIDDKWIVYYVGGPDKKRLSTRQYVFKKISDSPLSIAELDHGRGILKEESD